MRPPLVTSTLGTASATWSMLDSVATLDSAGGGGRLDVAAAERGIEVPDPAGGCDAVLGVELAPLAEHWLRGSDVIAVFEPRDARRLRSSVMWRAHGRRGSVVSWEVVVSAQTALLETEIAVAVRATVAAESLWWLPAGRPSAWRALAPPDRLPTEAAAILVRRRLSSCLVAVHPDDVRAIDVDRAADRCTITCRLFSAPLEKGVLLRSRVLAALGPAADDESWAQPTLQAFATSPPPLDT